LDFRFVNRLWVPLWGENFPQLRQGKHAIVTQRTKWPPIHVGENFLPENLTFVQGTPSKKGVPKRGQVSLIPRILPKSKAQIGGFKLICNSLVWEILVTWPHSTRVSKRPPNRSFLPFNLGNLYPSGTSPGRNKNFPHFGGGAHFRSGGQFLRVAKHEPGGFKPPPFICFGAHTSSGHPPKPQRPLYTDIRALLWGCP